MNDLLKAVSVPVHASVKLTGSVTVYVDPYEWQGEPHDADVILITHTHFDHFSPKDIAKVAKGDTVLVLPDSEKAKGPEAGFSGEKLVTLTAGGRVELLPGLAVEGVAAYNIWKEFHEKANGWLGYVVELDGVRYYVAGDTDDTSEAREVRCDVALVPVGGTYTMDARMAAELVNAIKPKAAVPIHYGTVAGRATDGETFRQLLDPAIVCQLPY